MGPRESFGHTPQEPPSLETFPPQEEMETTYVVRFFDRGFELKMRGEIEDEDIEGITTRFFSALKDHPVGSLKKFTPQHAAQAVSDVDLTLVNTHVSGAIRLKDDPAGNVKDVPLSSMDFFENRTTRYRGFFANKEGHIPYLQSLFGVGKDVLFHEGKLNQAVAEYAKSRIEGKKVLNIGGKNMLVDILKRDGLGKNLSPDCIVNIDPFLKDESVRMNERGIYKSVVASAENPELVDKLKEANVPAMYDEVWASYSVPMYLESPESIKQFTENLKRILAPGGMARIFPIVLAQKTGEDLYKHNFHQKKKALIEAVKGACGDEHFNAEVVKTAYAGVEARYLLLIQRLK